MFSVIVFSTAQQTVAKRSFINDQHKDRLEQGIKPGLVGDYCCDEGGPGAGQQLLQASLLPVPCVFRPIYRSLRPFCRAAGVVLEARDIRHIVSVIGMVAASRQDLRDARLSRPGNTSYQVRGHGVLYRPAAHIRNWLRYQAGATRQAVATAWPSPPMRKRPDAHPFR